jgi:lipoprotein signal peptidase
MNGSRAFLDMFIFASAVISDRATKYWALSGWFGDLYFNYGISFSLLKAPPIGLFVALLGIGLLGYACVKSGTIRSTPGIPLLLAGAVGNLIDRVFYGYVIDWIHVIVFLNLADLWLCLGGFQFLWHWQKAFREK